MESSKTYLTNGGLVTHSDTPQGFALFHSRTSHWPCTTKNWATQYVLYIQFENTGSKATPVVRVFLHATAINDIYDISTANGGIATKDEFKFQICKQKSMTSHGPNTSPRFRSLFIWGPCAVMIFMHSRHSIFGGEKKRPLRRFVTPPFATKNKTNHLWLYDWNKCTLLAFFFQNLYQLL